MENVTVAEIVTIFDGALGGQEIKLTPKTIRHGMRLAVGPLAKLSNLNIIRVLANLGGLEATVARGLLFEADRLESEAQVIAECLSAIKKLSILPVKLILSSECELVCTGGNKYLHEMFQVFAGEHDFEEFGKGKVSLSIVPTNSINSSMLKIVGGTETAKIVARIIAERLNVSLKQEVAL